MMGKKGIKRTKKMNPLKKMFLKIIRFIEYKKNANAGVAIIKKTATNQEMKYLMTEMFKYPSYRLSVFGKPFPKKYSDIWKSKEIQFYTDNVKSEMYWHACIFSKYVQQLNDFFKVREQFTHFLFCGKVEEAEKILNKIEDEFGKSLWLIENRIALYEMVYGIEKHKEFANEIIRDESINGLLRFIVSHISVRAENNVSVEQYSSAILDCIAELREKHEGLADYLQFKLAYFCEHRNVDYCAILSYEVDFSIIDRYLTFRKIATTLNADNCQDQTFDACYLLYSSGINDYICSNAIDILSLKCIPTKCQDEFMCIVDNYTAGKYDECIKTAEIFLYNPNISMEILELYIKAIIKSKKYEYIEETSIKNIILNRLYDVFIKNEKSNESFLSLLKIVYIYSDHDWSIQLYKILMAEYTDTDFKEFFIKLGYIYDLPLNPRKLLYTGDRSQEFVNKLNVKYNKSKTLMLYQKIIDQDIDGLNIIDIPNERKLKYTAYIKVRKREFQDAVQLYDELFQKNYNILSRHDALIGMANSYYNDNQIVKCIDLIVDAFFENESLLVKLPQKSLIQKIDKSRDLQRILKGCIGFPILCDLYLRFVNTDKTSLLFEAYEDLLYFYGISKPSDIAKYAEKIEKNKLIYFLERVCVYAVMDNSIAFNSSEEVQLERIQICQLLRKLNYSKDNFYFEEIKELTQQITVRRAIREVEESKIYVDVEGIKKSVEKNLKESYSRYITYKSLSIKDELPEYIAVDSDNSELNLLMPSNEKDRIFWSMINDLRDKFVLSREYGLDGYLSVGIRHGTLVGELRSYLEQENLITQKDKSGQYQNNKFWTMYFGDQQSADIQKMNKYLADFSYTVDAAILHLKNNIIQIKTEKKCTEGLFDYTISREYYESLRNTVKKETSYDEFIDTVFAYLWEVTDLNLVEIRRYLGQYLKHELNLAFEKLQSDLDNLRNNIDITEISNTIKNAKTAMQYRLDKVANWFKRAQLGVSDNYKLELPIQIGLELIKGSYPNKKLKVEVDVDEAILLQGRTRKGMVDIFLVLLDNIIKHCKIIDNEPSVKIEFKPDGEWVVWNVKNEDSENINIYEENCKLSELKMSLQKDKSFEQVNQEGGTGFHKINKILSIDLNCRHQMDFRFDEEHTFSVTIKFNKRDIGII